MTSRPPEDKSPLASFDPRFRQLLLEGCKRSIDIAFPKKGAAISFRQKLHTYRKRCRDTKQPDWEQLYRCQTALSRDGKTLTIRPVGVQFDTAFASAGLETTAPAPADLSVDAALQAELARWAGDTGAKLADPIHQLPLGPEVGSASAVQQFLKGKS